MFLFALKMCVADMKRLLHRFWWIGPLFIILMVISPFNEVEMSAFVYFICMTITLLIPRFFKIQFVLPLDEKQMKKYFVWRVLIVCGTMLLIAAVFIGICFWQKWPWKIEGLYWLCSYIAMYIVSAELGLEGLGIKKDIKVGVRQVIAFIVGFGCWFMGLIFMDYVDVKWILYLGVAMVILAIVDMIWYIRRTKVEDYKYVPFGLWDNGKVERN